MVMCTAIWQKLTGCRKTQGMGNNSCLVKGNKVFSALHFCYSISYVRRDSWLALTALNIETELS